MITPPPFARLVNPSKSDVAILDICGRSPGRTWAEDSTTDRRVGIVAGSADDDSGAVHGCRDAKLKDHSIQIEVPWKLALFSAAGIQRRQQHCGCTPDERVLVRMAAACINRPSIVP